VYINRPTTFSLTTSARTEATVPAVAAAAATGGGNDLEQLSFVAAAAAFPDTAQ
jgi:hypothetical protein